MDTDPQRSANATIRKSPALAGCFITMMLILTLLVIWFLWTLIAGKGVPGGEGRNGVHREEPQTSFVADPLFENDPPANPVIALQISTSTLSA